MSSESEDDFLSADEGSAEDTNSISEMDTTSTLSLHCTEEDISSVENKNDLDNENNIETKNKTFNDPIVTKKSDTENIKDTKINDNTLISENLSEDILNKNREEESKTLINDNLTDNSILKNPPSNQNIENLPHSHSEDSFVNQSNEEPKLKESLDIENKSDIDVSHKESKTKSINKKEIRKISSIGLKKPREKLGERKGVKKFATKISDQKKVDEPIKNNEEWSWSEAKDNKNIIEKESSNISNNQDDGSNWGSWANWGTTLVSAATTFTQELSEGVGSVIESVEGSLGVPNPETLLTRDKEIYEKLMKENKFSNDEEPLKESIEKLSICENEGKDLKLPTETSDENYSTNSEEYLGRESNMNIQSPVKNEEQLGLGFFASAVTGVIGSASNKVISGGLGTLEFIGKKTMDVIQEGDPGLRKKRALIQNALTKPSLNDLIQEAREKSSDIHETDKPMENKLGSSPELAIAWNNSEGPLHLEAVRLVANQSNDSNNYAKRTVSQQLLNKINSNQMALKESYSTISDEQKMPVEKLMIKENLSEAIKMSGLNLNSSHFFDMWKVFEQKVDEIVNIEANKLDTDLLQCSVYQCIADVITGLFIILEKAAYMTLTEKEVKSAEEMGESFQQMCESVYNAIEEKFDILCNFLSSTNTSSNTEDAVVNLYLQLNEGKQLINTMLGSMVEILQKIQTTEIMEEYA